MKRVLSLLLFLCMMVNIICIPATTAVAAVYEDVWEYTISGTEATITKYSGTETTVTVPSTVSDGSNTYTVTAIGNGSNSINANLVNVTLPSTIKKIGSDAFKSMVNNDFTINFPEGLEEIGASAFYDTGKKGSLVNIVFPSTLEKIGTRAFYQCTRIKTITFKSETAPAIAVYGSKEAFWNLSAKPVVYYPEDGIGYDDASFRRMFASSNATPVEGKNALTFAYIGTSATAAPAATATPKPTLDPNATPIPTPTPSPTSDPNATPVPTPIPGDNDYGIYTRRELADTKARIANKDPKTLAAFEQFMSRVEDWCMSRTSHAVEDYLIKGYYTDKTEHITASKDLTHDAYAAYATALAWQLTGESKYAEKARELLNGWATVNKTFSLKLDTPLVAAYGGVGFIYAAELITEYTGWTTEEQTTFKTWVKNLYQPAIKSIVNKNNNWAAWGVLACMVEYHYLGDTENVTKMVNKLGSLINSQIDAEGGLPLEISRGTNGMWYTYFCLAPLTQAAQIAYNLTGINYFETVTISGGSFTKALDNFLAYTKDPDRWDADYKALYYKTGNLNRPILSNGAEAVPNWPVNMYAAMASVYGGHKPKYGELTADYEPAMGGWTEREAHHLAWCFPSLIQPTAIVTKVEPEEKTLETVNFAPEAAIEVDSNHSTGNFKPEYMVDGIKYTSESRWVSDNTTQQHYVILTWDEVKDIDYVKIWSGYTSVGYHLADFTVDWWNGLEWVTAAMVTGNTKDGYYKQYNEFEFDNLATNKLRINIIKGSNDETDKYARIFEIEAGNYVTKGIGLEVESCDITRDKATNTLSGNVSLVIADTSGYESITLILAIYNSDDVLVETKTGTVDNTNNRADFENISVSDIKDDNYVIKAYAWQDFESCMPVAVSVDVK